MTDSRANTGRSLRFLKMHGLGNDFVVIDQRRDPVALTPGLVRAIGDRHRGVGFDQLAEITPADQGPENGVTAGLGFWNADGSTAGACGNATRCVADLLFAESGGAEAVIQTANGALAARRRSDGLIEVDMGPVHLDWDRIPLAEPMDTVALPLDGAPGAVNVGNPHCVFFVENAEAVALAELGPVWEHHPAFPERANVEFCHVIDRQTLRMRVWERGGMITQACGSGACAAVVAGARKGLVERAATVHLDGGPLEIRWTEDNHVLMAGPVAPVFEGVLSPGFLAAHS